MQYNAIQYAKKMQCNTMQTIQCNTIQYKIKSQSCKKLPGDLEQWNFRTMQWNSRQCNTMQYNDIQCNTMKCNSMQFSTIQYISNQCNVNNIDIPNQPLELKQHVWVIPPRRCHCLLRWMTCPFSTFDVMMWWGWLTSWFCQFYWPRHFYQI